MILGEPVLWKEEIWYVSRINKKTVCLINPTTRRITRVRIDQIQNCRLLSITTNAVAVQTERIPAISLKKSVQKQLFPAQKT